MFHATQGVLHAVLIVDHGGGDPSHVRGSQGDIHGDGRPRGTPHCVPHADDASRWLRRCEVQALYEHVDRNGHGLV